MTPSQRLLEWLDDLCVRFIINLPHEELQSVERICFQIEEAQWFYEDFVRPLDPSLPSMNLRVFSQCMFTHCPLFANFTALHSESAYEQFLQYKTRVPVRGAIMLNQEMTHAVLVKGWKRGAKWSFPRGKINKDEPDLDCAVREVYEETGLDLHEVGLVKPEEEMKAIEVNMREQSLKLYVFRGVPMDTYFEPRTRKEISKIDWYKLGDLPTIKRKNQMQQGHGQDLVKDNSFYMVTPFVGPLKGWIKRQRQLERHNKPAGAQLAVPTAAGVTDTELEADMGETTADEGHMHEYNQDNSTNFAELIANLGRNHRPSDALPEVQTEATADPASELKRLLSVGSGFPSQGPPSQNQARGGLPSNGMFDFFQGNNQPPHPGSVPRTPFDQLLSAPSMPQSPHGQHHPRQPHLEHMAHPPPFPYHPQGHSFHQDQPHHAFPPIPHQFFSPPLQQQQQSHFPPHPPNMQPPFNQNPQQRSNQQSYDSQFAQQAPFQSQPGFQSQRGPAVPPASKLPAPKLTTHTLGLLNAFKMNEKPATSSPQTELAAQSSQATPTVQQAPTLHRQADSFMSSPGTQNVNPYAPSPPAFLSPPPAEGFQPAQPKPRNAHQNTLLSLFSSPSPSAATPVMQKPPEEPAELSAFPSTPGQGHARVKSETKAVPPMPNMNAKPVIMANTQRPQPGSTSATVRGPVNAPDFDTMKRNSQHPLNGHSRGPSPAMHKAEPKAFVPQQILKRESTPQAGAPARFVASPSPQSPQTMIPPTTSFQPQILKRPQQPMGTSPALQTSAPAPAQTAHTQGLLGLFKSASPQPPSQTSPAQIPALTASAPSVKAAHAQDLLGLFKSASPQPQQALTLPTHAAAPVPPPHAQDLLGLFKSASPKPQPPAHMSAPPQAYDRRSPLPDQKNNLLALFGRSSPKPSPSPLGSTSPMPPSRSPHPPTPKHSFSGVISPVSPLPAGSQTGSPATFAPRSRISSIGDSVSNSHGPGAAAPTSHPAFAEENLFPVSNGLQDLILGGSKGKEPMVDKKANDGGKSPVDKTFLLGFLNDFAKKGR